MNVMLTPKEIKRKRKEIIKGYLDGNLLRFLRLNEKSCRDRMVYYKYLKKWDKQPLLKMISKQLREKISSHKNVVSIVNIMVTLDKYYDCEIGIKNARRAFKIWDYLNDDILEYNKKVYNKFITENGFQKWPKLTKEQAIKEQKARGFIHINDFEDYDRTRCYLFSIADDSLVLPIKMHHKVDHLSIGSIYIYMGMTHYGLESWTRAHIPNN